MLSVVLLCIVGMTFAIFQEEIGPEVDWVFEYGTAVGLFDPIPLINFPGSCRKHFSAAKFPEEDAVLIYGGRFDDGATNSVGGMGLLWKYILDEQRYVCLWRDPGPTDLSLPADMQGHAMVMLDDENFILFGGENFIFGTPGSSNRLWHCNIEMRESCVLLSGSTTPNIAVDKITPYPPGMAYHSMLYNKKRDRLYIFGGYTSSSGGSGCFNNLWEYDIFSEKWAFLYGEYVVDVPGSTDGPGSLCFHSMVQDEEQDIIYLYGGAFTLNLDSPKRELWSYKIEANTWEQKADAEYGLAQTSMLYHRNSLVFYGGLMNSVDVRKSWSGFMIYDIELDFWKVANGKTDTHIGMFSDFAGPSELYYRLESLRSHFMTMNKAEDTFYLLGGELWHDDVETCNANTWKFTYVPVIPVITTLETTVIQSTTLPESSTIDIDFTSTIETIDETDYFSLFDRVTIDLSLEEQQVIACDELQCNTWEQYQLFPFLNCLDKIDDTFIAYFGYVNTNPNQSPRIAENFITLSETCFYPSPATKFTFDIRNFFFSINFTDSVQWSLNGSSIDIFDDDFLISQCPDRISTKITLTNYEPRAMTYISSFLVDFLKIDPNDLTLSLLQSEKRQEEIIMIADVQITDPESKQEIVSDLSLLSEYPETLESHIVLSSVNDGGVLIGISEIRVLPTNSEIYTGNNYPKDSISSEEENPSGISDAVIVSIVAGSAVVVTSGIMAVLFSQDSVRSFICRSGI